MKQPESSPAAAALRWLAVAALSAAAALFLTLSAPDASGGSAPSLWSQS